MPQGLIYPTPKGTQLWPKKRAQGNGSPGTSGAITSCLTGPHYPGVTGDGQVAGDSTLRGWAALYSVSAMMRHVLTRCVLMRDLLCSYR